MMAMAGRTRQICPVGENDEEMYLWSNNGDGATKASEKGRKASAGGVSSTEMDGRDGGIARCHPVLLD